MASGHKPRSGSMAFYPRKKARRELATFRTVSALEKWGAKPLNFVGYKAGMALATAQNQQEKTTSFGQQINFPVTVIECPPMTVFGVRAYSKVNGILQTLGDATVEKFDKHFRKKFPVFKRKSKKKKSNEEGKKEKKGEGVKKEKQEEKSRKRYASFEDIEKLSEKILEVRLLCATKPSALDFGRKVPDIFEVFLGGNSKEQIVFAREKIGKEISIEEVFKEKQFVDVKAVDKGKGFSGVVKRFGVKVQRRKAKHRRIVGSISPWNPSTVMRTVARPGQLGYQSRTELNKRILKISNDTSQINVLGGFKKFGNVRGAFVLLAGSTPGPAKRAVSLREPVRKADESKFNVSGIKIIGLKKREKETGFEQEQEETKAKKVVVEKEKVKEKKSVEDEIKAAASGEMEKKEKKK